MHQISTSTKRVVAVSLVVETVPVTTENKRVVLWNMLAERTAKGAVAALTNKSTNTLSGTAVGILGGG